MYMCEEYALSPDWLRYRLTYYRHNEAGEIWFHLEPAGPSARWKYPGNAGHSGVYEEIWLQLQHMFN